MREIDLHGVRHKDIYYLLEKALTNGDTPFTVITGKSSIMKKIVSEIASSFGLKTRERMDNEGRVTVYEE